MSTAKEPSPVLDTISSPATAAGSLSNLVEHLDGAASVTGNVARPHGDRRHAARWRSSLWLTVVTGSFCIFVDLFLYGALVPVMPFALVERIRIQEKDIQRWTSLLLTFDGLGLLVASPIFGLIADRLPLSSRRSFLLLGFYLATVSTLLISLSRTGLLLAAGRLCHGLSSAIVWVFALAIVLDRAGPAKVGRALAWTTTARSASLVGAPAIAGPVYRAGGWWAVFAVLWALLGVDAVLRVLLVDRKAEDVEAEEREAAGGGTTSGKEAAGDGREKIEGRNRPSLEAGATATRSAEPEQASSAPRRKRQFPILLKLMRSPRYLLALWATHLGAIISGALDATLPLFVSRAYGWDSQGAGLLSLCLLAPALIGPPLGAVCDRYGCRALAVASCLVAGLALLLLQTVHGPDLAHKVGLCVLFAALGVVLVVWEIVSAVEIALCAKEEAARDNQGTDSDGESSVLGMALGTANSMFAAGMVVGPIWGGFLYERAGWATMTLSLGVVCGVTCVPSYIWVGGRKIGRRNISSPA